MNRLSKSIFQTLYTKIKNGEQNLAENLRVLSRPYNSLAFPSAVHTCPIYFQFIRNEHNGNSSRFSKMKDNGNGPTTIVIPKTLNRFNGRRRIRDSIEDRGLRFRRSMQHMFEKRQVVLTNTRKKIQEKGKLIIQDIKETREKVKEKIEEVIEKENIYTVPNLLCVTRIALSPLLAYLVVLQKFEYALAFMIVSGVSDWVDGWIARNYKNQSSKLGSFLDPMADKVLIGTLFLSLTYVDLIPVPLTALIVSRDIVLIVSGFVIRYNSLPPPRTISRYFDASHATAQLAPTFVSKVNTGIQLVLVGTTLAAPVFDYVNHPLVKALWYITATSTIISASSYIFSKETYKYLKPKKLRKR